MEVKGVGVGLGYLRMVGCKKSTGWTKRGVKVGVKDDPWKLQMYCTCFFSVS